MYTLHIDKIRGKIQIRQGFTVDYDNNTVPKNYNNNGVWGVIVNNGTVVKERSFNKNRWYGEGSFPEVEREMRCDLTNLNNGFSI